jgi:DNA-binding transcriptional MerR regulator
MSDPTDIAARTQRFRDAVRAFTPPPPTRYAKLMPLKDGIIELREKGASLRLIRELLATVDVAVSIDTIARFLAEVNGEITAQRRTKKSGRRHQIIRQNISRRRWLSSRRLLASA